MEHVKPQNNGILLKCKVMAQMGMHASPTHHQLCMVYTHNTVGFSE